MSRPKFLADEDWRFEIVQAVRRLEPSLEIVCIDELGRKSASDVDVLEFAHRQGLIVLSHDVTTLRPEAEKRVADGRAIAGVLLASQRSKTREIAESIVLIWSASDAAEWSNRIEFVPL